MEKNNLDEKVVIYTDGGCDPNPGVGGWGAVLSYNGKRKMLSGGEPDTTNNRMEMMAAIAALDTLKRPCSVILYTDSQYLKNGITSWMHGWKKNNWKRKGGELKNIDLWKQLDTKTSTHSIEWRWVRGHTGVPENELCDTLATEAIKKQKEKM